MLNDLALFAKAMAADQVRGLSSTSSATKVLERNWVYKEPRKRSSWYPDPLAGRGPAIDATLAAAPGYLVDKAAERQLVRTIPKPKPASPEALQRLATHFNAFKR